MKFIYCNFCIVFIYYSDIFYVRFHNATGGIEKTYLGLHMMANIGKLNGENKTNTFELI